MMRTFGAGVAINPHVVAFALLAQVVNHYLREQKSLGIFISDENKEIVADVEKAIKLLSIDASGIEMVDRITHVGVEPFRDVLDWIKKGAARE